MGEKQNRPFQLSFNPCLKVDFQGSRAEAIDSPQRVVSARTAATPRRRTIYARDTARNSVWDRFFALSAVRNRPKILRG